MVTTQNFASLRMLNFGVRTLSRPLTAKLVAEELHRYNTADAARVSALVRANCGLQPAMDRIIDLYERVLTEARQCPPIVSIESERAVARYLEDWTHLYKQSALSQNLDAWYRRCLNAEELLQEKEAALSEAEQEKAQWVERCTVAESAGQAKTSQLEELSREVMLAADRSQNVQSHLAEQDGKLVALSDAHQERVRWMDRCSVAESQSQELRQEAKFCADQLQEAQNRLAGQNRKLAALEREIASLRNSATWKLTQRVLQVRPVHALFGRWIQAVAERFQRRLL